MRTTWIVWSLCAMVSAVPAGAGGREGTSDPPLRAIVSPHFGQAPALVRIQAIVLPATENRSLLIVLESDRYYRSSAVPLDGDTAARVHHAEFRSVPAGLHSVTVTIADRRGSTRGTVHDVIRIME